MLIKPNPAPIDNISGNTLNLPASPVTVIKNLRPYALYSTLYSVSFV